MAGFQVAVVTPTTLLARQHGKSFTERFKGFPIEVGVLSRMTSSSDAKRIKENIASGDCQIAIGTHALLSKSVNFNNLGLVIVDEEQNFGVTQKEKLKSMRGDIHVLTLSATPIPRTMTMVCYGDMDVSSIKSKPKNRLPIKTSVLSMKRIDDLIGRISEAIEGGNKVYWICPLIEESESMSLTNVNERLASLQKVFSDRVGLIHGKLTVDEKESVMEEFVQPSGKVKVLVSKNHLANLISKHTHKFLLLNQLEKYNDLANLDFYI